MERLNDEKEILRQSKEALLREHFHAVWQLGFSYLNDKDRAQAAAKAVFRRAFAAMDEGESKIAVSLELRGFALEEVLRMKAEEPSPDVDLYYAPGSSQPYGATSAQPYGAAGVPPYTPPPYGYSPYYPPYPALYAPYPYAPQQPYAPYPPYAQPQQPYAQPQQPYAPPQQPYTPPQQPYAQPQQPYAPPQQSYTQPQQPQQKQSAQTQKPNAQKRAPEPSVQPPKAQSARAEAPVKPPEAPSYAPPVPPAPPEAPIEEPKIEEPDLGPAPYAGPTPEQLNEAPTPHGITLTPEMQARRRKRARNARIVLGLNALAVCLMLWVVLGLLRRIGVLPELDLGYSWFNTNMFKIF